MSLFFSSSLRCTPQSGKSNSENKEILIHIQNKKLKILPLKRAYSRYATHPLLIRKSLDEAIKKSRIYMKKTPIYFFSEDIAYILKEKIKVRNWIHKTILNEGYTLNTLNFIFCSDDYLLKMNQDYLKHDTYTDIITFDNSETENEIFGDIFISVDRILENAQKFNVSTRDEAHRIMIHGILHLLGYQDKSKTDKAQMTEKEDKYLKLRSF